MSNGGENGFGSVTIVGGCGHVGLPLGVALANAGATVALLDLNERAVATVNAGRAPFHEPGLDETLAQVLAAERLVATGDPTVVKAAEVVVVVVGTPIDEHHNPDLAAVTEVIDEIAPSLDHGQLLVLRSTVFPGVTGYVERQLRAHGLDLDVAFCPERIAEGHAMTELLSLPQIIGARDEQARERASALFGLLTEDLVHTTPEEAELAKLFTNTWRYIKFAAANQFFMIANDFGLDFERIRHAITHDYPRAADMPGAGFAAGPCLFKDTMQLAAFNNNHFPLGQASVAVNEGLPLYLASRIEDRYGLEGRTVGILGMAFKGGSDDTRSSLSYKLRRILRFKARDVLCHDPFVTGEADLVPLEEVLERADLLVIAAPHPQYRDLVTDLPVVDIWNLTGNGVLT
ncbi:MAG: nucleotide sugar dehydrogenase [Acidimicrobiales bacterium]|nr:nucleotide sugar dehydrogenase [Acidimicrobiales bacterium]